MRRRIRGGRTIQVSIYSGAGEKPLFWVGSTLTRLREFPAAARRGAGHQLHRVQCGLEPDDWKPMKSVGPGVGEIRVHAGGEYRVIYVARFAEGIYVLHAFEKRERATRRLDIEIARSNLAASLEHRER
jgi:phage-related protein